MATPMDVFERVIHLSDNGDEATGNYDIADNAEYKHRLLPIIKTIINEIYPYSDTATHDEGKRAVHFDITDLDEDLDLDDYCVEVLVYGVAARMFTDENGNLASWWSKEDYEAFKGLTQQMIEQWDGIPFHGGKVNGTLVVSENIADNGGMAVTLAIAKNLPNPDYQAYFKNWARVWCRKAKEEYISLLLQSDVHSPAELRANIQPRNFPEWYQAFDVKETDEMYIAPEKRIIIW